MIQHVCGSCGLSSSKKFSTILYEYNMTCITQIKEGCTKEDKTKHISQKLLYTHDLEEKR